MEVNEFRERVRELTVTKSVLSRGDLDDCYRISSVVQAKCRDTAQKMIESSPRQPWMWVYMCDGWSTTVDSRFTRIVAGDHLVMRRPLQTRVFVGARLAQTVDSRPRGGNGDGVPLPKGSVERQRSLERPDSVH